MRFGKIEGGTGFFVASQCVVTCAHVINEKTSLEIKDTAIPGKIYHATLVDKIYCDGIDLALLETTESNKDFYKLDSIAVAGRGAIVLGYPDGISHHDSAAVILGGPDGWGRIHLESANAITQGYSGGPVCPEGEDEVAVGIVSTFRPMNRFGRQVNVAYMIPASEILKQWRGKVTEKRYEVRERATNDFVYHKRSTDFVGYDNYIKQLEDFVNSSDPVLWTAVIGEGGMGKSRLAFEFACSLGSRWECRLVRKEQLTVNELNQIRENAGRDLLLIVDYAYTDTGELGTWIKKLFIESKAPKVRIILLQRQGGTDDQQPEWEKKLLNGDTNRIKAARYRDVINLGKPEKDMLLSLMVSYAEHKRKGLDEAVCERLYSVLQRLDEGFNRPLFAMFVTEAYLESGNVQDWDKEMILSYFCNRELDMPADLDVNQRAAYHLLLVLATMAGGYAFGNKLPEFEDFRKYANAAMQLGDTLWEEVLARRDEKSYHVAPMKPDLLGEYLVRNYLKTHPKYISSILLEAAKANLKELQDFLTRMFTDFSADEDFTAACCGPENLFENDVSWGLIFRGDDDLLRRMYENHFPNSDHWLEQYAKGLVNQISNLGDQGKTEEAEKKLTDLEALYQAHGDNAEVVSVYAKGLFNQLTNLGNQGKTEGAENKLTDLEALYQAHGDNAEVVVEYAKGLANQIIDLSKQEKMEDAVKKLIDLEALYQAHGDNAEVAAIYAYFFGK